MEANQNPTTDDVTDLEHDLLALVEDVAASGALTEDDRHTMSFRTEVLCAELRGCIDGVPEV
ncbi:hypothetical protein [Halomarina rubra]|uniref:Uncharacterized protein n=1 Tax=Halomarina rubra TaxID=2071873 RepID=A0ABD6AWJ4_9EURY|nr:hypothetical protein [Halomarina rubra]